MGLRKVGLRLCMFRSRGTTRCIGEDAESMESLPLATGVGDRRSWKARGVCFGNLADPSTWRRCALAWRRLDGRKFEQGESRSASRVMFHTNVRYLGRVNPTNEGWVLPVHLPFIVSPTHNAGTRLARLKMTLMACTIEGVGPKVTGYCKIQPVLTECGSR